MANYPDLNTMFNNGMGSMAALQSGRMTAQADQMQQEELMKQQMARQQQAQMNPLDLMFRQGQVDQQAAQLPGLQAQSDTMRSQANVQQGTESAQIAAQLSELSTKIGAAGMQRLGQDGHKLSMAAQMLESVPDMGKQAALNKIMQDYQIPEDNPMVGALRNAPPASLVPALKKVGEGMALASEKYIQESALSGQKEAASMERVNVQNQSQEKIAGGNNATALQIARENNAARTAAAEAAASVRQQVAGSKMSTDQKIAALSSIPDEEKSEHDVKQLAELKQQRLSERAAPANALSAQLLGMQSPQDIARGGQQKPLAQEPAGKVQPLIINGKPATSNGRPVFVDGQGNRFIGN